jgi:Ca2+-binding EF-hand superfamily protein
MQLPNLREHYQEEEIGELSQAAFQLFDHNKDHSLEKKEYEEMAKHMGQLQPPLEPNADEV